MATARVEDGDRAERPDAGNRRQAVPFDPDHFARTSQSTDHLERFQTIYRTNFWAGPTSRSGAGAGADQTMSLRAELPKLFRRWAIGSLLDLPCGDGSWMAAVDLEGVDYLGADLVPELVDLNRARRDGRRYQQLDLVTSALPSVDLIFCRDCLVHFSAADICAAVDNVRRAGIRYLLTTTFPSEPSHVDIVTGDWRPLNLERAPFDFPPPVDRIVEGCTEAGGLFPDKSLGLWRVADLPKPVAASAERTPPSTLRGT